MKSILDFRFAIADLGFQISDFGPTGSGCKQAMPYNIVLAMP